ncbi:hypothetical protein HDU98_011597 [Podochytrium sp. JEL0797]|nr:hypothetical protein HDU98_011597 [Podochytrium sp. JEL0797]
MATKKKGKKGGAKGKKKSKLVKGPDYFARKGPISTGPFTFDGKTGPEAQIAFEMQASAIRERLKFDKENTFVCLRVRQVEIEAHDFYVTLPKTSTLHRVQREIAKRQHLGAVTPSEIAIYKPTLEKKLQFGSSLNMLRSKENLVKQQQAALAAAKAKYPDERDTEYDTGLKKPETAVAAEPNQQAEEEADDPFEYYKDNTMPFERLLSVRSKLRGSFVYNPDGLSSAIVPPPEPVKPEPLTPPKPKKEKADKKKKGKASDDDGKKKKKKKAAPKKTKPVVVLPTAPILFAAPTPITVYYDVIPYITCGADIAPPRMSRISAAGKEKGENLVLPNGPQKQPTAVHKSHSASITKVSAILNSRKEQPKPRGATVDVQDPLLLNQPPKPPKIYGLKPAIPKRPRTANFGDASSLLGSRATSMIHEPFQHASLMPFGASSRGTSAAPTKTRNSRILTADGQLKIRLSRPSTAVSAVSRNTTLVASTRPNTGTLRADKKPRPYSSAASTRPSTAGDASVPWDKRWMTNVKAMGGGFEWEQTIRNCDAEDEEGWESDEEGCGTVVESAEEEDGWKWRMQATKLSAEFLQWKADAKKRIDTVTVVVPKDKKGKKGKTKAMSDSGMESDSLRRMVPSEAHRQQRRLSTRERNEQRPRTLLDPTNSQGDFRLAFADAQDQRPSRKERTASLAPATHTHQKHHEPNRPKAASISSSDQYQYQFPPQPVQNYTFPPQQYTDSSSFYEDQYAGSASFESGPDEVSYEAVGEAPVKAFMGPPLKLNFLRKGTVPAARGASQGDSASTSGSSENGGSSGKKEKRVKEEVVKVHMGPPIRMNYQRRKSEAPKSASSVGGKTFDSEEARQLAEYAATGGFFRKFGFSPKSGNRSNSPSSLNNSKTESFLDDNFGAAPDYRQETFLHPTEGPSTHHASEYIPRPRQDSAALHPLMAVAAPIAFDESNTDSPRGLRKSKSISAMRRTSAVTDDGEEGGESSLSKFRAKRAAEKARLLAMSEGL